MEELVPYIREAVDRKQENMRRRRRRDALRLQLVRVLELIAEYGTFGIWLVNTLTCPFLLCLLKGRNFSNCCDLFLVQRYWIARHSLYIRHSSST